MALKGFVLHFLIPIYLWWTVLRLGWRRGKFNTEEHFHWTERKFLWIFKEVVFVNKLNTVVLNDTILFFYYARTIIHNWWKLCICLLSIVSACPLHQRKSCLWLSVANGFFNLLRGHWVAGRSGYLVTFVLLGSHDR